MSDPPVTPGIPADPYLDSDPRLLAERAREERAERWLLIRHVAIVLALVALLVAHAVLG